MNSPSYEIEYVDAPSGARVVAIYTPMHPYLAEYERSVSVYQPNGKKDSANLFPDTGGYRRSHRSYRSIGRTLPWRIRLYAKRRIEIFFAKRKLRREDAYRWLSKTGLPPNQSFQPTPLRGAAIFHC